MTTYSLYEVNEFLRRVVALNFRESVWIAAEIAQIGWRKGHAYISFVQKEGSDVVAQSEGILWADQHRRVKRNLKELADSLLQEGVEIHFQARVEFHERYGLQLIVEAIDPAYTVGKWALQRMQVIGALQKEGLIGKNASAPMPPVLQSIAVISSAEAAGMQDFSEHLTKNNYGYSFRLQLFPAAMQGIAAEKEVLAQLERIAAAADAFDCVAFVRGGGARLDLSAFDTLAAGRAIAEFPIPALVGIGHETDQTIPDLVAFASLKTPTAVADFILSHNAYFESQLIDGWRTLQQKAAEMIRRENGALDHIRQWMQSELRLQIERSAAFIAITETALVQQAERRIRTAAAALESFEAIIGLLDVEATLRRGFSITRLKGAALYDAAQTKPGDEMETQLAQGVIKSTIR